jgi:predicted permease
VADFGISRAIHAEVFEWGARREIDASAGTPAYVSPEQATGERDLDARSDIYSLGCVVFEMLSGETPFDGANTTEIVAKRFRETVPDLSGRVSHLPKSVCGALANSMALERESRPQTPGAFVAALSRGRDRQYSLLSDLLCKAVSFARSLCRRMFGLDKKTRRGSLMETLILDLRYSVRRIAQAPWFTAAAVMILAVGIGGNSAIFSVLRDAILVDPPYPEAERLVLPHISHVYPSYTYHGASYPELEMLRDIPDRLIEPLAGYALEEVTLSGVADAERIEAEIVTPDYYRLLGVSPPIGRAFTQEDGDKNSPSLVVLIGDGLWASRFGRDPEVLGRELFVNGNAVSIIGVMPRGFRGVTGRGRLWLPMAAAGKILDRWRVSNHGSHWFSMLGRLRAGVTYEAAEAQLAPVAREIRRIWPDHGSRGDLMPTVQPFRSVARNETAQTSLVLLAVAAALVLLIVCANLAGLLLARTSARARETAIRIAIGAGRWRVARQYLMECLTVGLIGGAASIVVANWGVDALAYLAPISWIGGSNDLQFVNLERTHVDGAVVLFALGLAVVTSLLFGALPAIMVSAPKQLTKLRAPLAGSIDGSSSGRRFDIRGLLVSGQVALALVLLVGASLMVFTMARLQRVLTGIDERNLLAFSYTLPRTAESDDPHFTLSDADAAEALAFHQRFVERLQSLPGLDAATTGCAPLGGLCASTQVREIEGRPAIPESEWLQVGALTVEDSYFEAVGARLVEGRTFSSADWMEAPQVLILNETAARELFPNETGIGQRLSLGHSFMPEGSTAEVVGIASDIRYSSPEIGAQPVVYLSSRQIPLENPTFIVRTAGDPYSTLPAIRAELNSLNASIPINDVTTVEALGDQPNGSTRLVMNVLSIFAAFATLLAVVGVYAVIAYAVSRRTRELGIRIALGAPANGVLRLVLQQGAVAAGLGVVVGIGAALGLTRLLSSMLFEVNAADPLSFGLAAVLLFSATLLASYIPARRVTKIDPIEVLRSE